jgi:hypothetical protein
MTDATQYEWDSAIDGEEGGGFTLLAPGEYSFEVTEFTRGTSTAKQAPLAKYRLRVFDDAAQTSVLECIILHSSFAWKITEFFVAIGQMKSSAEKEFKPNWDCVGAQGRVRIKVEPWTRDDGEVVQTNKVERFLAPVDLDGIDFA